MARACPAADAGRSRHWPSASVGDRVGTPRRWSPRLRASLLIDGVCARGSGIGTYLSTDFDGREHPAAADCEAPTGGGPALVSGTANVSPVRAIAVRIRTDPHWGVDLRVPSEEYRTDRGASVSSKPRHTGIR